MATQFHSLVHLIYGSWHGQCYAIIFNSLKWLESLEKKWAEGRSQGWRNSTYWALRIVSEKERKEQEIVAKNAKIKEDMHA